MKGVPDRNDTVPAIGTRLIELCHEARNGLAGGERREGGEVARELGRRPRRSRDFGDAASFGDRLQRAAGEGSVDASALAKEGSRASPLIESPMSSFSTGRPPVIPATSRPASRSRSDAPFRQVAVVKSQNPVNNDVMVDPARASAATT